MRKCFGDHVYGPGHNDVCACGHLLADHVMGNDEVYDYCTKLSCLCEDFTLAGRVVDNPSRV